MRKASTELADQGTQAPFPALDRIPAETVSENLHWNCYIKREHFRCEAGEVHVWQIELDWPRRTLMALRALLSADEQERASRFQSAELSRRWTIARAAVRSILARYAGAEPQLLRFRAGAYGKPELAGPSHAISFNLSRSRGLALLAVAEKCRIGIDAEMVHSGIDIEGISRRFFACAEADEISALATDARLTAFFACWTRKEAFVKAIGAGLSLLLNGFRVTVRADQSPRLVSVDGDNPDEWSLVDLSQSGVAAALAVEGPAPILRRFSFCPPADTD